MTGSEPPLPDTPLISGDEQQSGLWLLDGQMLANGGTTPLALPPSRTGRIAHLLVSAAQRAGWPVLPNGPLLWFVLIGLAAWTALYLLPSAEPMRNTTVAASQAVPSAVVALPARPVPPEVVALPARPVPPAAATTALLDQALTPPPSIGQPVEEPSEPKTLKPRSSHRPRHVKRVRAKFVHAWMPVVSEPCRYNCDNWTVPMTWHGGGY
jgi:hypothetical protein